MKWKQTVLSDEEIVELYWLRDELAIRETDVKYGRFLLSVAYNIVHDNRDGEECLNDTYIGAWNAIPPHRPNGLQAFLTTIMRRVAINRYRANHCEKRLGSEFVLSLSELENFIATEGDMDTEMETRALASLISRYVRSLSDRQMVVFISRYYACDPIQKIANELGCSISTVKRELYEIKIGLKNLFEKEGYSI